jgi:pyridoxamine 5'-phosphate oxidase-like protein
MPDDDQALAPEVSWGRFAAAESELAGFGATLLAQRPCYLATVREGGTPRVHPVTPILAPDALFVFMEPTSPKRRDLLERGWFALHNGVPDNSGTGGEFFLSGRAFAVDDDATRAIAVEAASYDPADRYVLFELRVSEARCNGYGDVTLPPRRRWSARSS